MITPSTPQEYRSNKDIGIVLKLKGPCSWKTKYLLSNRFVRITPEQSQRTIIIGCSNTTLDRMECPFDRWPIKYKWSQFTRVVRTEMFCQVVGRQLFSLSSFFLAPNKSKKFFSLFSPWPTITSRDIVRPFQSRRCAAAGPFDWTFHLPINWYAFVSKYKKSPSNVPNSRNSQPTTDRRRRWWCCRCCTMPSAASQIFPFNWETFLQEQCTQFGVIVKECRSRQGEAAPEIINNFSFPVFNALWILHSVLFL